MSKSKRKRAHTPSSSARASASAGDSEANQAKDQRARPEAEKRNSPGNQRILGNASGIALAWHKAYAGIPVVLALLTSINTLQNRFAYDDINQILNNEFIRSFHNLPMAFTSSVWSFLTENILQSDNYFRPLFTTLFTINYAIFGTTPWGWHLVNVLIHAGVTFFVFAICKELTDRNWLAMTAAALFAVHPIHAESVAWISGVPDGLSGLFMLPAFYFYLRYRNDGRKSLIAAAMGAYFLAILTKETAIVLPAVIAYCELSLYNDGISRSQRLARAASTVGLFALPALMYFLLRYHALGTLLSRGRSPDLIGAAFLTAPLVMAKYLLLLVWPVGYNVQHYTTPVDSMVSLSFLGPVVLLVVLAIVIVRIRCGLLTFASVWLMVFLVPPLASLKFFPPLLYVQERYLYLPSIGFCLAVALAIEWLWSRKRFGVIASATTLGVTTVLIVVWSAVLINQNEVWRDSITLFQRSVSVDPNSGYARSALSTAYYMAGDVQSAEQAARSAIERDPLCIDGYQNLSLYLDTTGRTPEAIQTLERAKSVAQEHSRSNLVRICRELGKLYQKRNDFDRAEENFKLSVEGQSSLYPPNLYALGTFYLERGRYEEARQILEEILPLVSPTFAPIHLDLGHLYDRLGQPERARAEYETFLKLATYNDPNRDDVLRRLTKR